jgi:hypothetical protein
METFVDERGGSEANARNLPTSVIDRSRPFLSQKASQGGRKMPPPGKYTRFFPHATFWAMICAILLMDAILPLRDLWFHEALLTQLGVWPVAPSLLLFPGWRIIPPITQTPITSLPNVPVSWGILAALLGAFLIAFLVYIVALRKLPTKISGRFIIKSTLVLGLLYVFIPVVTSPDIYSYIAYARIGIVYGMNPLTTIPRTISTDAIYGYISWVDQPSAYGPIWTLLTCFFQLITSFFGLGNSILWMVLILRTWGLLMHLCSVALIWSLGGSLQRLHGIISQEKRLRATLAFAWNPLLLLEACTNAHTDSTLLFLVLLTIWFLVFSQNTSLRKREEKWGHPTPRQGRPPAPPLAPAVGKREEKWQHPTPRQGKTPALLLAPAILLALGTCLKINLVLLASGLFFYQWLQTAGQPTRQRIKQVGSSIGVYAGLILALYAPFWQGGAILDVFAVNPAASRAINTFADTLSHLFNSISLALGFPVSSEPIGSPSEHFLHTLSLGLFVLIYAGLCWQMWRTPALLRTIYGLVRWMALTWLLYCAVGSPWFWPWYLIPFLGIYALIEASKPAQVYIEEKGISQSSKQSTRLFKRIQTLLLHRWTIRALTFSMFTLYCFITWGPQHSFVPFLPELQWSYLNGLWAWGIPLLVLLANVRGVSEK